MTDNYKSGCIALVGPPNAGKSTFLNTVLGEKIAIVTPKPQTTRNSITGIHTTPTEQIVFLDTPGFHTAKGKLNRFMLDAAWNALRQTHGAILFLDATRYLKKEELLERDLRPVLGRFDTLHTPPVVALNKVDAVRPKERLLGLLSILGNLLPKAELIPVSALTGDGIERLLAAVRAFLPEGPPLFPVDQLSTAPVRFLASEIIREKLFLALNQELPYNVAVEIESWEERVGVTIIAAAVYTSKNSHKGMIVGRQGQNLKQVGQAARQDLKELLGTKVHLELWVKVREGWTEDGRFMLSLGLGT